MRIKDYVPPNNVQFNLWQKKLIAFVQTRLVAYNIPAVAFNPLLPLQADYEAKQEIAEYKQTRTSVDVENRDIARAKFETALRQFNLACLINNPFVSDGDRLEMGIPIHDKKRTAPPIPDTTPLIELVHGKSNNVILLYQQQGLSEGDTRPRAKPEYVHHLEFCYKVGTPAPASPDDCNRTVIISKNNHKLNFNTPDSGKRLYGFGRWVNSRNQPGGWTPNYVSIVIP